MENSAIKDGGRRSIQFFDWALKKQSHSVAKMGSPLVAASQTVHAGNIALLDADFSFVAPVSSELGWRVKRAVQNLVDQYGTEEATTLYERNGVYVFDAWIKPGPGEKSQEMNVAKPRVQVSERWLAASRGPGALEQVGERSLADSRVRISDKVDTEETKGEGKGWETPKRGKTISKKDQSKLMQSHSKCHDRAGNCDCNEDDYSSYGTALDDGYWSGFIRRVPGWP